MSRRYTDEQKNYIREIAPGRYNQDIADLFNKKFGTNLTEGQIKSFKANHGIQSNLPSRRRSKPDRIFTNEQEKFIRMNVKGRSNAELAELFNNHFGVNFKVSQIKGFKQRNKLSSGLTGQFEKGAVPANKGTKGLYNVGGNRTSFKPGHKPKNYRPVGSERICSKDGYVLIKVQDTGRYQDRWKLKHKVIWEKANGPIPSGYKLLFLDQDKQNISLDNLVLIPQSKLSTLNKEGLLHKDAELTRTGLIVADLYQKISHRKRIESGDGIHEPQ